MEPTAWAAIGAIVVAFINTITQLIIRGRDNVGVRLQKIEEKQQLTNRAIMTNLKLQLQRAHDEQHDRVLSPEQRWSPQHDQTFREGYAIYKELGGNGIIDSLKVDMDRWREANAGAEFVSGRG